MTRINLTNGNVQIPSNGSWQTILSHWHTPSDASSFLHVDLVAVWKISAQSGSSDGEWLLTLEIDDVTIGSSVFVCEGNRESGSCSPIYGLYTNSSTSAKQIVLYGKQLFSADQSLIFNNPSTSYMTNWIDVTEVKR